MPHLLHPYKLVMGGNIAPVAQANFAAALNDFTTLSSTSTMPTGGSISRAGNAMVTDSTGKLTWAANNQLSYSEALSNSTYWAISSSSVTLTGSQTDPFGGTGAFKATVGSSGVYKEMGYSGPSGTQLVAGNRYVFSMYFKKGNVDWVALGISDWTANAYSRFFNVNTGAAGTSASSAGSGFTYVSHDISPVGSTGWYRCYVVLDITTTRSYKVCDFMPASADGNTSVAANDFIYAFGGQMELVTYQTTPSTYYPTTSAAYYGPRLDYYWNGSAYVPKGYLVEGAGANKAPYSQGIGGTGWATYKTGTASTPTAPATNLSAPDGTSTASRLVFDRSSASDTAVWYDNFTGTAATHTGSVWLKADGAGDVGKKVLVGIYDGVSVTFATEVTLTANWTRYSVSGLLTAVTCNISIGFTSSTAQTGTVTVNAWGAQAEASSFVTSYLPTGATVPVNRAAETLSLANYTNRLVEAFYIDEQTGVSSRALTQPSATSPVTISGLPWGWLTSLRAYTNGYAGDPTLPAWLSVAATGNRMYYDSTGYLTWAAANLVIQSSDMTTASWTPSSLASRTGGQSDPFGGSTGVTIIENNSPAYHQLFSATSNVVSSGTTRIVSFYVKPTGSGSTRWVQFFSSDAVANGAGITVNASTGAIVGTISTGSGWVASAATTSAPTTYNGYYRVSFVLTAPAGNANIAFSLANSASLAWTVSYSGDGVSGAIIACPQIEQVTYQTAPRAYIPTTTAARFLPRFDVDPATLAARGLLIEGAATNLCAYSEALSNGYYSFPNSSVGDNVILAPNGVQSADKIKVNTTSGAHGIAKSSLFTAGQTLTVSAFVKAGEITWCVLGDGQQTGVYFDLVNGVAGTITAGWTTRTPVNCGNGWYRVEATVTAVSLSGIGLYAASGNNGIVFAGANNTDGFYAWGLQAVVGSTVTSYIPTTTASVTRSAETPSAALYTTNPSIIQYCPIPAGTRARKIIDPFSGISSETNEWIESGAVYPMGTGSAYLNTKLTVDGPY